MTNLLAIMPGAIDRVLGDLVTQMISENREQADIKNDTGVTIPAWKLPPETGPVVSAVNEIMSRLCSPGEKLETLRFSEMLPGHWQPEHRDNQKLDGTPNHTPQRTSASMLYLPENDLIGGEIYFSDLGVVIQPQWSLAVSFPGHFSHGVHVVRQGIRRAITAWYVAAEPPVRNDP